MTLGPQRKDYFSGIFGQGPCRLPLKRRREDTCNGIVRTDESLSPKGGHVEV